MVLICLEYTVATAFEIELNLFSLEEVMEHEHGVAAVRFVALGLDALGWYAFKTNVVRFIALLVLQPIDVTLLSQKEAWSVSYGFRFRMLVSHCRREAVASRQ